MTSRARPLVQICNECGRSVAWGSGRFVNRVPDLNSPSERRRNGKPFPQGDFLCAECDEHCPLLDGPRTEGGRGL